MTHINASYVRSHFDSIEVGLNDAPRADEMALVLVMTTGGTEFTIALGDWPLRISKVRMG